MKKKAFTLAEVLITLAIIGIVAALTIPTLVQNFQQEAWNTSSEVFLRKLEESLKVMNVQGTLAGYTTTEAFVNELSKHIKITKMCKNDDITSCFADKVYWGTENEEVEMSKIKNSKNFGQDEWETETIGVQFANGTNAVIAYNPTCKQDPYSNQITGTGCLAILYDVDGYKKPNTQQKDLRAVNVKALSGKNCAIELSDGTCLTAPFQPSALTEVECEAAQEKLGIENCKFYRGHDYWAGAVKACGGVKNMPTKSILKTLAQDLYQDTEISDDELTYGRMNLELASKMGFTKRKFLIWAAEEHKYTDYSYYRSGYTRTFYDDRTIYGAENSYIDSYMLAPIYTVCLSD